VGVSAGNNDQKSRNNMAEAGSCNGNREKMGLGSELIQSGPEKSYTRKWLTGKKWFFSGATSHL